ncbi:MlaD family protein [Pseudomonas segetis]|uniref:Phospholipid/cholesterol/gamma-HCH transport system substrate-binding protein n=1 Tax=Pseudomonas segetis TaxID=298908 RepID=A0A239G9I4_9PSED|nr:MlaD family protein [Pseudomonas segetis]SNS65372.1 phospholipid/cholesterol/gamma-HCH transport system substrate-binding protein [Pseudomonas segetis]
MEPRAHHVLIGLFTVLVVSAALVFAIWLSKHSADQQYNEYSVVFNETVSGLSRGSSVQYSGITIGDVQRLFLDPKDPRKVIAWIRIVSSTPIKTDTRARLSITGITGTAVIQMHGGTPKSPALLGEDGERPRIIADLSPLSKLLANGDDLVINVNHLINQANHLLNDENLAQVSKTLKNLEAVSAMVAEQRDTLNKTAQEISVASTETVKLMRNANSLLNDSGRKSFANIERISASLERSSSNIERILDENRDALRQGMQGVSTLGPAINDLRDTLSTIRSFSRRIEDDPAYLLRSDTIKEFQP